MADRRNLFRSIILGILVILIGFGVSRLLQRSQKPPEPKISFKLKQVKAIAASPKSRTLIVEANGRLRSKNRLELYSEVTGQLQNSNFRVGTRFRRGQTLVSVNESELKSQVKAARTSFAGLLSQSLPDIAVDFESEYATWKNFLSEISAESTLPGLPAVENSALKQFLAGRSILSNYYSIKSQEVRLSKHRITAPFSGILTETLIDPGTLVRAGQKLGSFSQEGLYEAELAVDQELIKRLKPGMSVKLSSEEQEGEWKAKISRINSSIDPNTQMVSVFVELASGDLRDGLYITASIDAGELENVIEIDRRFVVDENFIYTINKDSLLELKEIQVESLNASTVFVSGVETGTLLQNQYIPEVHPGLKVIPVVTSNQEAE